MTKKVTFGDVEVKEMSIDLPTHRMEVKNPKNLINITSGRQGKIKYASQKSSYQIPSWLIWVILALILVVIIYLIMSAS